MPRGSNSNRHSAFEILEDRSLLAVNVLPFPSTLEFDLSGRFSGTTFLDQSDIQAENYTDTFHGDTLQQGTITYTNESSGVGQITMGLASGSGVDNCSAYSFAFSPLGALLDENGALTRTATGPSGFHYLSIPDRCEPEANRDPASIPLVGTFNTRTFETVVNWRRNYENGYTNGEWRDTVQFRSDQAYDIQLEEAEWTGEDSLTFSFTVVGPPQHAPSHTTPVGSVRMFWAYGDQPSSPRWAIGGLDAAPIYWNSAGAIVTVTDLPKTARGATHLVIVADDGNKLAELNESNNFAALPLVKFLDVLANYDDQSAPGVFGTYIGGVTLDNVFAATLEIHGYDYKSVASGLTLEYAFGAGSGIGIAHQASGDHGLTNIFVFVQDMGSLAPFKFVPLTLWFSYIGRTLAQYDGVVRMATDLDVQFEVDYGDGPVDLANLRLLDEVKQNETWQITATVSDIPQFPQYENLDVSLVMRPFDGKDSSDSMERLSRGVYRKTLNFGMFRDLQVGADYLFLLKPTTERNYQRVFTKPVDLLVISLPTWLKNASIPVFSTEKKAYDLKLSYTTAEASIPAYDPTGLLNGKLSGGALHVVAPILVKPDITEAPIARIETFAINGHFLDQPISYSVPTGDLALSLNLDPHTLDLGGRVSIQMREPAKIDSFSTFQAGGSDRLRIPSVSIPDLGTVDTDFDIDFRAEGSASVRAGIVLEKVDDGLIVVPEAPGSDGGTIGSFVRIVAVGGAFAEVNAGISLVKVGPCSLAELSGTGRVGALVHGVVTTRFSGDIRYVDGELIERIDASIDDNETGAALGVAYQLYVTVGALCNWIKTPVVDIKPDVKTYQLFGSESVSTDIKSSFAKGEGIFAGFEPPPSGAPSPAAADGADLAANPAAGSPPAEPQGTLTMISPAPWTAQAVDFGLQVFANLATLSHGRHRLDVVLREGDHSFVIRSMDLADLALEPDTENGGFTSGLVARQAAVPAGLLSPGVWYSLSFEFYSDDGADGELVELGIATVDVLQPSAELLFVASAADLSNGQVDFGPDSAGSATVQVRLANVGFAPVRIESFDVGNAAFEVLQAPMPGTVLAPGGEIPITVRLAALGSAVSSQLRVRATGMDEQPIDFSLGLAYDGAATIDTSPPQVLEWRLRSSHWSDAVPSLDPTSDAIRQTNLDQIVVMFDEPVVGSLADLSLRGAARTYTVSDYSFDALSNTATWTFAEPIRFDNLAMELSDGITDEVGLPLAPMSLRFSSRSGDIDGDGRVGLSDLARLSMHLGELSPALALLPEDLDYDGVVYRSDAAALASAWGANADVLGQPNERPVLYPVGPQSIEELQTLSVQFYAADVDSVDPLHFSLLSGPSGASIDSQTGEFRWTPGANDGPGTHQVTVRVTDEGLPPLSNDVSFSIQVVEPIVAPQFDPTGSASVLQGETLFLPVSAVNQHGLRSDIEFGLDAAPQGMTIDALRGTLTWAPTYGDLPGDYEVVVRASNVGAPWVFSTASLTVHVLEANVAPRFTLLSDMTFIAGQPVVFSVSAGDENGDAIVYSLGEDAPAGATIDPETGYFEWLPGEADYPGNYVFSIFATDDGAPSASSEIRVRLALLLAPVPVVVAPVPNVTVVAGEAAIARLAESDDDGAFPLDLAYFLEPGAPEGAAINEYTGEFYWPVPVTTNGDFSITVRVEDRRPGPLPAYVSFIIHVLLETAPPEVTADLASDTGVSGDLITADPTIVGIVADLNAIQTIQVRVAGESALGEFVDVPWAYRGDGNLEIDPSTLAYAAGGFLADGSYVVDIVAVDAAGNTSLPVSIAFELRATPPSSLLISLATEFDTGAIGDAETEIAVVDLVGATSPGLKVDLVGRSEFAFADSDGLYRITGVPLAPGYNALRVRAATASGLAIESPLSLFLQPQDCTAADPAGSMACSVGPAFEEISQSGEALVLGDDGFATLTSAELGGFNFSFYGVAYDMLFVSSNGLITFRDGYRYSSPTDLSEIPLEAAIAVLWDDWHIGLTEPSTAIDSSGVYWQLLGDYPARRLVIEWNHVLPPDWLAAPPSDPVTFQAILYEGSNRIVFQYEDLETVDPVGEAGTATVGVKGRGAQYEPRQWLPISIAGGPNSFVASGKGTLITPGQAIADIDPPIVTAYLLNDAYPFDGATTDPTTFGSIEDASSLSRLTVSYDSSWSGSSPDTFFDITYLVEADGSFTITPQLWADLLGGVLAEGDYVFYFEAEDALGNTSEPLTFFFRYDLTAPSVTEFSLDAGSEGAEIGDGVTPFNRVVLRGFAEPGAYVFVAGQESATHDTALEDGQFLLRRVSLSPGSNALTIVARDGAGNESTIVGTITHEPAACIGYAQYEACLVDFEFDNLTATGQRIDYGPIATNSFGMVDLPEFEFSFFGGVYSTFWIAPVGGIIVGEPQNWSNQPEPQSLEFERVIAPLWDYIDWYDIYDSEYAVYWRFDAGGADPRLTIEWHHLKHWGTSEQITFQAVLHSSGEIQFNYLDVDLQFESTPPYSYYLTFQGIINPPSAIVLGQYGTTNFTQSGLSVRITPQSAAPSPAAPLPAIAKAAYAAEVGKTPRSTSVRDVALAEMAFSRSAVVRRTPIEARNRPADRRAMTSAADDRHVLRAHRQRRASLDLPLDDESIRPLAE